MKRILIFALVVVCALSFAKAQDVIVLKNTEEIQAKVLEVSPGTIKYVEWRGQDGPTRILDKKDVFVIKYQNGKKEVFADTSRFGKVSNHGKYINRIRPQAYLYFGTPLEKNGAGPAIDASFGARFYDYFYLGLELEYACVFEKAEWVIAGLNTWMYTHLITFSANMKAYLSVSEKVFPFMNLSLGLGVFPLDGMIHDSQHRSEYDIYLGNSITWFNMQIGAGVDLGHFSLGIGYHVLAKNGVRANLGYLKVGVRL